MVHYFYCVQVILIIYLGDTHTFANEELKKKEENQIDRRNSAKNDSVFVDVLKNITRVNGVLEDLILNYEKLQKIYKSQESLTELSSEDEVDEVYKHLNKKKQRASSIQTTKSGMHATQMFFSEEKFLYGPKKPKVMQMGVKQNTSSLKLLRNENNEDESQNVEKKESAATEASSEESETNGEDEEHSDSSNASSEEIPAEEATTKNNHIAKNKPFKIENKKTVKAALLVPEKTSTGNLKPIQSVKIAEEKAKFHKSHVVPKKPNQITTTIQPRTFKKKIIKAEEFSQINIWDKIRENQPIKLKTEREIIYSKRYGHDEASPENKESATEESSSEENAEKEPSSASVEDEKLIVKEQFKTRILRKAYGDACLKVVIKKCYRACKDVIKTTCKQYSCKQKLKDVFRQNSKTGCIKEFQTPVTMRRLQADGQGIDPKTKDDFRDIIRNGYLAAACLPPLRSDDTGNNKTLTEKGATRTNELNILRDRFERACQKTSCAKCTKACQYAANETCNTLECRKNKKKSFKKNCRKQCKKAYRGYDQKLKSDSSESSDSETSTDESDSDNSDSVYDGDKKKDKNKDKNAKITKKNKNDKKRKETNDSKKLKETSDFKKQKGSDPKESKKRDKNKQKTKDSSKSTDSKDKKQSKDRKNLKKNPKDSKEIKSSKELNVSVEFSESGDVDVPLDT